MCPHSGRQTDETQMRMTIEIDDRLMAEALRPSGLKTRKAAVEQGLRLVIAMGRQPEIASWYGKLPWDGDLEAWRLDDIAEDKP
jgi:Arc/MetJ family transcription regulator